MTNLSNSAWHYLEFSRDEFATEQQWIAYVVRAVLWAENWELRDMTKLVASIDPRTQKIQVKAPVTATISVRGSDSAIQASMDSLSVDVYDQRAMPLVAISRFPQEVLPFGRSVPYPERRSETATVFEQLNEAASAERETLRKAVQKPKTSVVNPNHEPTQRERWIDL